ncbi:MAG: glycosyltransferase family 39 protein [archaeon]
MAWLVFLIVVSLYVFIVFFLSRLVIPYLGFRKPALRMTPTAMKKDIDMLAKKHKGKQEFLEASYAFLSKKFYGSRLQTVTKFPRVFSRNISKIYSCGGFQFCTQLNLILRHFLIRSGKFSEDDIRYRHTFYLFNIHQHLEIRVKDNWLPADLWGAHLGVPVGEIPPFYGLTRKETVSIMVGLVGVSMIYGLFLRLWGLGVQSLWLDETISAMVARNILEVGRPLLDSGWLYPRAYFFHYLTAGFMMLGGVSDVVARLPSVFLGVGTSLLIYFLTKTYSRTAGFFAFAFSMFSEVQMVFSRQVRMYQLLQLLFVAFLLLLHHARRDRRYLPWLGLIFIIAYDTSPLAVALLPIAGLALFWSSHRWKWWLIGGIGVLGILLLFRYFGAFSGFSFLYLVRYVQYFRYYAPFIFVAIIGAALTWKNRLTILSAALVALVLLAASLNILFAFRYVYVLFPMFFVLAGVGLSRIKFRWPIFLVYLFAASNLLMPVTATFILAPQETLSHFDSTMPQADFRGFYAEVGEKYPDEDLAVTLTAPAAWYGHQPDYWIPISLTGLEIGNWTAYNNTDWYTDSAFLWNLTDFSGLVAIDSLGARRISPSIVKYINDDCEEAIQKPGIIGFLC